MVRTSPRALLMLMVVVGAVVVFCFQGNYGARSQSGQIVITKGASIRNSVRNSVAYLYYTLKDTNGFVLARAPKGTSDQPLSAPQSITPLGDGFGLSEADNVTSMQLSPDGAYLAINGSRDHGEQVWIYNIRRMTVGLVPANVSGNFLHWLPRGNGHSFLYRPMFPLGPNGLMNGTTWNPGLWIVDAANATYKNIDIHMSSAFLVDAAPSPDGTQIVYSTTPGLGMGSDTWLMNSDGSAIKHLFMTTNSVQAIAGLFTWSPDGKHVAYERLSDSSTPFLPAGLWMMNAQGGQQQWLAKTDGGHGFMPAWSPDGRKLAFVVRTNLGDRAADMQDQALHCAIGIVDVASKHAWLAASADQTGMQWNINPTWTADSASITFTALNPVNHVLGGTPRYWSAGASETTMRAAATPLTPALSHVVAAE